MNPRIELTNNPDILRLVPYGGGAKQTLSLVADEPQLYIPAMYLDKIGRDLLIDILQSVTNTSSFTALQHEDSDELTN